MSKGTLPRDIRAMINRCVVTIRQSTARLSKVWKVNVGEHDRQGWMLPEHDAMKLRETYFTLLGLELTTWEARRKLESQITELCGDAVLAYVKGEVPWTPEPDMTVNGGKLRELCKCGCGYPTAQVNGYVRGHTPEAQGGK